MKYGLSKVTIDKICGVFAQFPEVQKAVLYGSRAKGNYKTGSDIDLTLYGTELTLQLRDDIADALDDLLLPYLIDLSIFDELENDKLREHIKRVGVVFYEGGNMDVPKNNWEVRKLEELCSLFDDGDWIESKDQSDSGIRLIQTGNVGAGKFKDRAGKARYISEQTFVRLRCTEIVEGDCLVSRLPDPVGRACIIPNVGERMITAVDCTIIRFKKERITPVFFNYYTQSKAYLSNVDSLISGATRQRISRSNLGKVEIPFPPLHEQQQIVAILDEAFAAIAKAKENAEKNLKNARELFESYLQSVFANAGDGWEEKRLGDVCEFYNGFAFKSKDTVEVSNTQLIRMGNLYKNKLDLDRRGVYYPDGFSNTYKKFLLTEGDLIISLTGTTGKEDYGFTVRIPSSKKNLLLNQRIAKIVILDEKQTIKEYLLHFLLSRTFLDELYKTANGTRQANLSTNIMKEMLISMPKSDEQKTIITKLDSLSLETKKLEDIYRKKLACLEELKKSLLQKAFSGQLSKSSKKAV